MATDFSKEVAQDIIDRMRAGTARGSALGNRVSCGLTSTRRPASPIVASTKSGWTYRAGATRAG